ncbi:progranulin-like isoform X2 [Stigmatopora nigra]
MPLWCWCVLLACTVCAALVCPDGSSCSDGSTCCEDILGRYGCCPLPRAVCCSDALHCCPEATVCDLEHATCTNATVTLPWKRSLPATTAEQSAVAVMCPDQRSECPDSATCCQLPDGSWGCCPLTKAVCCDDKRHCCPEGSVCDLAQSKCVSPGGLWRPLSDKLPAAPRRNVTPLGRRLDAEPGELDCPDKRSTCPDETTCCQMTSGQYGCCPMPDAVCCSDRLHCCPHGTVCNLAAATCERASVATAPVATAPVATAPVASVATAPMASAADVKCDDKSGCAAGTTCCKLPSGEWGCCPLVKAVCCADHQHCCPQGYTCNMATGTCQKTFAGRAVGASPPGHLLR